MALTAVQQDESELCAGSRTMWWYLILSLLGTNKHAANYEQGHSVNNRDL